MAYGFVYVLLNDSMPGVFKIGMTNRTPCQRCDELSASTSSASPFEVMMYLETSNPRALEAHMHSVFADSRVSENREFFKVDLRVVHEEFKIWQHEHCILAVSYAALGVMSLMDYEDLQAAKKATEVS